MCTAEPATLHLEEQWTRDITITTGQVDGEVARQSRYPACAPGGECVGDGLAYKGEGPAIAPHGDKDYVVLPAGVRHYCGSGVSSRSSSHIPARRHPTATSSVRGPWLRTQTSLPAAAG